MYPFDFIFTVTYRVTDEGVDEGVGLLEERAEEDGDAEQQKLLPDDAPSNIEGLL